MLVISEAEIRRYGCGNALVACWRQWRAERGLMRRGIRFRSTEAQQIEAAYAAMTLKEFDAVNGRQDWANWRTIPRCLSGNVPDRPLRILDLGCGSGGSTRVLTWYAPAGSRITGYELAEPLLKMARRRDYLQRSGHMAHVEFVKQSATDSFTEADGVVAQASVDVASASGVVGHHLDRETVKPLIRELRRVLRPGAIAMLDVGPTLSEKELTPLMLDAGFAKQGLKRSWWFDPTGQVVYRWAGDQAADARG